MNPLEKEINEDFNNQSNGYDSNININNSSVPLYDSFPAATGNGKNGFYSLNEFDDNANNQSKENYQSYQEPNSLYKPLDNNNIKFPDMESKYENLRKHALYAYIICGLGAGLSLLVAILGLILNQNTVTTITKFLIGFGFASICIFLFGIWALYNYMNSKNTINSKKQIENREYINLFILLNIILLFIFLIFVFGTLAFRKEATSYITGLGQNASDWTKVFGNIKYSTIEANINGLITAIGIFSIIMSMLIILILVLTHFFLETYRYMQLIAMYCSIMLFAISSCLIYVSLYADRYGAVVNFESNSLAWVPILLFVCAIITSIAAFCGYLFVQELSKMLLSIYYNFLRIWAIVLLICCILSVIYSTNVTSKFDGNCKVILKMLPHDFLVEYAGCTRKYVSLSDKVISECPKERNIIAWEANLHKINQLNKNLTNPLNEPLPMYYGCYDNFCCTAAYNALSSKSNYMSVIIIALFLAVLTCAWIVYNLSEESGEETRYYYNTRFVTLSNIFFILLIGSIVFVLLSTGVNIPKVPLKDPTLVDAKPSFNNTISSDSLISKNLTQIKQSQIETRKAEISNLTKITEIKSCGKNCPIFRYKFQFSSRDGFFFPNKTNAWEHIIVQEEKKIGDNMTLTYEGGSNNLQPFFYYYDFIHRCPVLPSSFEIKVSAEVKPPQVAMIQTGSKSLMQNFNKKPNLNFVQTKSSSQELSLTQETGPFVVDYSKYKIGDKFDIFNQTIDYSFVTQQYQYITGLIVKRIDSNTTVSVENAVVNITSIDFPECKPLSVQTDASGKFLSPKIYIYKNNLKTNYLVRISAPDLNEYNSIVTTGGLAPEDLIELGTIELWPNSISNSITVSASVFDAIENAPLQDVKVTIKPNHIFSPIEEDTKTYSFDKQYPHSLVLLQKNSNEFIKDIAMAEMKQATTAKGASNNTQQEIKTSNTDKNGVYNFTQINPGLYTIVFEKEGYYQEVLCK